MNICIYGASSDNLDKIYFDEAFELGRLMAANGHTLIFGGGEGGLMGACARGVHSLGGSIIGIAPKFFDEPGILCTYCTEFIFTETMNERKKIMEDRADAFITLPGGIGTFEEFFETLTLKQLGRHGKPMAVLNTEGYYDAMAVLLENAADKGFMSRSCLDIFDVCSSPAEALQKIENAKPMSGSIKRFTDYNK